MRKVCSLLVLMMVLPTLGSQAGRRKPVGTSRKNQPTNVTASAKKKVSTIVESKTQSDTVLVTTTDGMLENTERFNEKAQNKSIKFGYDKAVPLKDLLTTTAYAYYSKYGSNNYVCTQFTDDTKTQCACKSYVLDAEGNPSSQCKEYFLEPSEKSLREELCFGPYMNVREGIGGKSTAYYSYEKETCISLKPGYDYDFNLEPATDEQISNVSSRSGRRISIIRAGAENVHSVDLSYESYVNVRDYTQKITVAIDDAKNVCEGLDKNIKDLQTAIGWGIGTSIAATTAAGVGTIASGLGVADAFGAFSGTKNKAKTEPAKDATTVSSVEEPSQPAGEKPQVANDNQGSEQTANGNQQGSEQTANGNQQGGEQPASENQQGGNDNQGGEEGQTATETASENQQGSEQPANESSTVVDGNKKEAAEENKSYKPTIAGGVGMGRTSYISSGVSAIAGAAGIISAGNLIRITKETIENLKQCKAKVKVLNSILTRYESEMNSAEGSN